MTLSTTRVGKPLALSKRSLWLGVAVVGVGILGSFTLVRRPHTVQSESSAVLNVVSPDDVQVAFAGEQPRPSTQQPAAILLPHHLVARGLIARAVFHAQRAQPQTIVVLCPDHENRGQTQATISASGWASPWATYAVDSPAVAALQALPFVRVGEEVIRQEHSVLHPLPFLQYQFPTARFVLITFRGGLNAQAAEQLAQTLNRTLAADDLVVASVDFSHATTAQVAQDWDAQSLVALQAGELAGLTDVHADSPQVLAVAMAFAKLRNAGTFQVLDQSTAAAIQQDPNQPNTTSYITGVWEQEQ